MEGRGTLHPTQVLVVLVSLLHASVGEGPRDRFDAILQRFGSSGVQGQGHTPLHRALQGTRGVAEKKESHKNAAQQKPLVESFPAQIKRHEGGLGRQGARQGVISVTGVSGRSIQGDAPAHRAAGQESPWSSHTGDELLRPRSPIHQALPGPLAPWQPPLQASTQAGFQLGVISSNLGEPAATKSKLVKKVPEARQFKQPVFTAFRIPKKFSEDETTKVKTKQQSIKSSNSLPPKLVPHFKLPKAEVFKREDKLLGGETGQGASSVIRRTQPAGVLQVC